MVMRSLATRRTLLSFYYTKETYHSKAQYVVSKLERELASANLQALDDPWRVYKFPGETRMDNVSRRK